MVQTQLSILTWWIRYGRSPKVSKVRKSARSGTDVSVKMALVIYKIHEYFGVLMA
jgi:hypothetical protein